MACNLSVCIPCRNEEAVLAQTLQAIRESAACAGEDELEIVIADHGSTDGSRAIAKQFRAKVVCLPHARTVAELRNGAAAAARGKWLVFSDADCLVQNDWVKLGLSRVRPRDIIGAQYRVPDNAHWAARTWYERRYLAAGPVSYVPSSNLWINAELFRKVNGFSSELASDEDCELCERVRQTGGSVIAYPDMALFHLGAERSLGQFFKRQLWHGREAARVFLEHFPRLRNVRPIAIAVFFLLAGAGALVSAFLMNPLWLGLFGISMVGAALIMALANRPSLKSLPSAVILCFLYGVARAACLIGVGLSHSPRKSGTMGSVSASGES
jgi:glycosyltransferase involved in cell wall biosynthesis